MMNKLTFGKGLLTAGLVIALTPSVILADVSMSESGATTENGTTTITPPPAPKTVTPDTYPPTTTVPPAKPVPPKQTPTTQQQKQKQKQKQKQQQKARQQQNAPQYQKSGNPDPFRQDTSLQDIPAPDDLNSD